MAVFTAINHFNEEPSIPTPDSTMTPESMEEVSSASTTQVKKEIDQKNANPTLPSTPQKRGTDQDPMNDDDNEPSAESPNKEAKSKSPSKKSGVLGPIPSSYEEASAEDKMIIQMKEVEGKAWADIKKALEEITGAKMGGGIHVRYARMKANFVVFDKGDEQTIMSSKKEIEERFEAEKWQKIADAIEVKSGHKYPSSAVLKKFKEMSKKTTGSMAEN